MYVIQNLWMYQQRKRGKKGNDINVPRNPTVDVAFAYIKICLNQVWRRDWPVAHVILGESVCSVPIFSRCGSAEGRWTVSNHLIWHLILWLIILIELDYVSFKSLLLAPVWVLCWIPVSCIFLCLFIAAGSLRRTHSTSCKMQKRRPMTGWGFPWIKLSPPSPIPFLPD